MTTPETDERAALHWWNILLIGLALLLAVALGIQAQRQEGLIRQRVTAHEQEVREELERDFARRLQERIQQEVTAALAKVEQRVRTGLPAAAQRAQAAIAERNYGEALISIEALQEALQVAAEAGADTSVTQAALRQLVDSIKDISPDVPQQAQQVLSQIEALVPSA